MKNKYQIHFKLKIRNKYLPSIFWNTHIALKQEEQFRIWYHLLQIQNRILFMMFLEPLDPKVRITDQAKHCKIPSRTTVQNNLEFRVRYKIRNKL